MEIEGAGKPAAAAAMASSSSSSSSAAAASNSIIVEIEVCLNSTSTARPSEIKDRIRDLLGRGGAYTAGPIAASLLRTDDLLSRHVHHARVCDIISPEASGSSGSAYLQSAGFWESDLQIYLYTLNEEGPEDGDTGGGGEGEGGGPDAVVSQYTHWGLPSKEFEGVWESLLYEDEEEPPTLEGGAGGGGGGGEAAAQKRPRSDGSAGQTTGSSGARGSVEGELSGSRLKPALLQYASSAMLFADAGVDAGLISCNHVILLHGPPGTGKTSLCKALAHKLSIRLGDRYPSAQLIEINAHSLFSRWFSESGKLVHRLFAHIREMVEDEDCLVMLLIDEVESLTAARKAAVSGSEPSDAVRVVNAVLTAIDSFRTKKNVLLLTTSNVSEAIDVAFVDRADIKALVGPPGRLARYDIIASCVRELVRVGLVALSPAGATLGSAREASAAAALAEKQAPGSSSSSSSSSSSGSSEGRGGVGSAGATGATASGEGGSGAGSAAAPPPVDLATMASLWRTACASHGFSGRTLRKLPLAAHALFMRGGAAGGHSRERRAIAGLAFAEALHAAVREERASRVDFKL